MDPNYTLSLCASHNSHPLAIFHMLHMFDMLCYNLVSRNGFLDSHLPLRQRNNLITKRSRDFLQRLASSLPIFLMSAPSLTHEIKVIPQVIRTGNKDTQPQKRNSNKPQKHSNNFP
jgi:hypothetical protein